MKALPELIRERTEGNPFFIEEVVQALVEDGSLVGARGAYELVRPMEKVTVPPTVQAVLAARIDRLESREKHLLHTAAVIGREFAEPVLKRVTELPEAELPESLGKLAAAEFIYEEALYPQAEYAFKHPLTQEVAYRSQSESAVAHACGGGSGRSRSSTRASRRMRRAVGASLGEAGEALGPRGGIDAQPSGWGERPAAAPHHWRKVHALGEDNARVRRRRVGLAVHGVQPGPQLRLAPGCGGGGGPPLHGGAGVSRAQSGDLRSLALLRERLQHDQDESGRRVELLRARRRERVVWRSRRAIPC